VCKIKKKSKGKKTKNKLKRKFVQNMLKQLSSNLACRLTYLAGISEANFVDFCIRDLGFYENHIFFLPVNKLTVLHVGFLGHTTVS